MFNLDTLPPVHPGEYLKVEFLDELNLSAYALAKATHMPSSRLSAIINGKRNITADTALRLAKYFGNSPQFWLNMQNQYDLQIAKQQVEAEFDDIHGFSFA